MTDEVTTNLPDPKKVVSPSLGEVLFSARTAKKLSIKDVSNTLRLSTVQIEALETNNFAALPQPMATRGFIRNYARLLELDAEPLLENYRALMPDSLPSALSVQTSTNQVMISKNSKPTFKYIFSGMSLVVFLVLLVFYISNSPQSEQVAEKTVVATPSDIASVNIPLPEIALPAAERQAEAIDAGVTAESAVVNTEVVQPVAIEKPNVIKENVVVATQPVPVVKSIVDDVGNGKNVTLSVSEEVWVQVKDKSGAVIYEKKLAANTTDGFDGLPPLYLWVGNAKATTVTFLGRPVDLTSKTKNNIARITLE
jgi:cytoskeleton protein RodZ